jgi:hypothetical protein
MLSTAGENKARAQKLIKFASSARDVVVKDGSRGAHNYSYSSWLLEAARDSVSTAIRILREGS